MTETAYAMVAQVRRRELRTRLALAAFIAATGWFVAPGVWPVVWLAAVLASQVVDGRVFGRFLRHPEKEPGRREVALACAVTAGCVAIYSGMAGYLWFAGGDVGRVFALIQVAGGLLHVSLHMHRARPVLIAAVATHGAYFLGLPVISAITEARWQELLISIGCLLYMSHLVVAVRQSTLTTGLLQSARDAAREAQHKAEVASAAKSDFLAVISHEIRTPMNAVISAANLLRRTELSPAQREHVAMLTDAGDVLMGLLNDVLDFSKIEAGKMELESAVMDVRERLTALCRLWEPRATAAGVRLAMEVDDAVPQAVRTDPLRFQQILFNLMSNAVKFTGEGEIRLRASWSDGRLSVAVSDTGCGIPADRLPHMFNSFEQADAGTTRRYGGTGLGLSISRKLARIMGGELTVDSREGVGSTFTLVLPLEVAAVAAVSPGAGAGDPRRRRP
ncbi:MAG: hypothetical protein H2038_05620 [Brevundimonas sp.]|uniref:sensor histidine kinase n=1 Tax=Brevundimonas sp. TaxID=1871086 RepID=UPI0018028038|nr:ATP-binding protein [Brevundimonas sp.]MBA4804111.1 hypothetical protein [Brevundimonas sp.]